MAKDIGVILISALLMLLGWSNMRGNISSIHWYNRRKVSEADRPRYGRLVGLGSILAGASVLLIGLFEVYPVACVFAVAGLLAGLLLILYAQFKYNHGLF